jgi:hypothetical protein
MRKFLPAILVILIFALGGLVYLYLQSSQQPLAAESVLPQSPQVFLHLKNPAQHWDDFAKTEFFKKVSTVDLVAVMRKTDMDQKMIDQVTKIQETLARPELQVFLRQFLGQEVVLATYTPKGSGPALVPGLPPLPEVFLVTRLNNQVRFAEQFSTLLSQINKDIKVEEVQYQRHKIYIVSIKDKPLKIAYTRIKDLLIVGLGDGPVKQSIDTSLNPAAAITNGELHQKIKAKALADAQILSYISFDTIIENFKTQLIAKFAQLGEDQKKFAEEQVEKSLGKMKGFKTISFSSLYGPLAQMKIDVFYKLEELDPDVKAMYNCQPTENPTLGFAPQGVLAYQWTACLDAAASWKQMVEEYDAAAEAQKAAQAGTAAGQAVVPHPKDILEQVLGMDIETEVLPVIGSEIGGWVTDVVLGGPYPVPKIVFFIQVKDKEKALGILEKVVNLQPFLRPEKEDYQGTGLNTFKLGMGTDLQPGYCILDNYLMAATSVELLKQAIDNKSSGQATIKQNPALATVEPSFFDKNNSVTFLAMKEIAGKAESFIDWSQGFMDSQDAKREAYKAGIEGRLKDVAAQIEENQKTAESLDKEIEELNVKMGAIVEQPDLLAKANENVDRDQKFIRSLEESLAPDLEEKKKLDDIKNSSEFKLPPEGVKRLAALVDIIDRRQKKLVELKNELTEFEKQRDNLMSVENQRQALQTQIEEKEQKATALRTETEGAVASQADTEKLIKNFENQRVLSKDQREFVVKNLTRPLIQAGSFIRAVSARLIFTPDVLESVIHFSVE